MPSLRPRPEADAALPTTLCSQRQVPHSKSELYEKVLMNDIFSPKGRGRSLREKVQCCLWTAAGKGRGGVREYQVPRRESGSRQRSRQLTLSLIFPLTKPAPLKLLLSQGWLAHDLILTKQHQHLTDKSATPSHCRRVWLRKTQQLAQV